RGGHDRLNTRRAELGIAADRAIDLSVLGLELRAVVERRQGAPPATRCVRAAQAGGGVQHPRGVAPPSTTGSKQCAFPRTPMLACLPASWHSWHTVVVLRSRDRAGNQRVGTRRVLARGVQSPSPDIPGWMLGRPHG